MSFPAFDIVYQIFTAVATCSEKVNNFGPVCTGGPFVPVCTGRQYEPAWPVVIVTPLGPPGSLLLP